MFNKDKTMCPLIKKACIENKCAWWSKIYGNDANGKTQEEYSCAVVWLPVLLIENARETRGVHAATESFRNEMKTDNSDLLKLVATGPKQLGHG